MSNLRDLIHYADLAEFDGIVGAASSTCTYTNLGSEYPQIKIIGGGTGNALGSYNCWNQCHHWKAPQGTKFIRFDIWGAGGSGAATCCCSWGYPAASGAWTYKILCCREYGDLSGCPYEMQVHGPGCTPPGQPEPYSGCKTFIRGYGLCNFCAEGGFGGFSCCSHNSSHFICGNTDFETQRRHQQGGGHHFGAVSQNGRFCGEHGLMCGFGMFAPGMDGTSGVAIEQQTSWPGYGKHRNENRTNCDWDFFDDGYINRKYGIGFGNTFGSNCQRVNIDHFGYTPCYGQTVYRHIGGRGECAQWYGGDGGHHGLPPMTGAVCNNGTGDYCMIRQYVPFPGGHINDRGGYYIVRNHTNDCSNEFACHMVKAFGTHGNWTDDNATPVPGMGGWSSTVYGGTCRCGHAGGPGAVIITYHT